MVVESRSVIRNAKNARIFALLVLIRSHYTIWEPSTGYYVFGIWISASKKSMRNADWRRWYLRLAMAKQFKSVSVWKPREKWSSFLFLRNQNRKARSPVFLSLCTDATCPILRGGGARSLSLLRNRIETLATQAWGRLVKTSNKHTLLNWNYCCNVHKRERTKVT